MIYNISAYLAIIAGLAVGTLNLYAQETAAGSEIKSTDTQESINPEDVMAQCMGMMKDMGMSDEMMKRMDAMMKTPVFLDSPCAVYGQKDRLNLTDEQKQKLIQIENEARDKTLAVLSAEQIETLGALPDKPMPMLKMCQEMRGKMMPMMQGGMGQGMMKEMSRDSDITDSETKVQE